MAHAIRFPKFTFQQESVEVLFSYDMFERDLFGLVNEMKNKLLTTTASMLSLSVTAAQSADLDFTQPGFDWSGWYGGLNAGVAVLDGDISVVPGGGGGAPASSSMNDVGFTGGVQLGYNWQDGSMVFGLEGDFNYLDVGDDLAFANKLPGNLRADYDWFATVRGRAATINDDMLFYVTGGVAFLDSELILTDPFNGALVSSSDVLTGWTVGAGVEKVYDGDTTVKLVYLFADFDDHNITNGFTTGQVEPQLHVVRFGVNWHF